MILAIETATSVCAVALVSGGIVRIEQSIDQPHVHSEKLLGMIHHVLSSGTPEGTKVRAIAISIGPGSFTGLRIGLSVAKGLCYAWNVPLVPVPTLHALANNSMLHSIGYGGDYILSLLDAKKEEVYAAIYVKHDRELEEITAAQAVSLKQCLELVEHNHKTIVLGDAIEKFQSYLLKHSPGRTDVFFPPKEQRMCSAASVGILGEQLLNAGHTADTASIEPVYIKEFVTTAQPQSMVNLHGMV